MKTTPVSSDGNFLPRIGVDAAQDITFITYFIGLISLFAAPWLVLYLGVEE